MHCAGYACRLSLCEYYNILGVSSAAGKEKADSREVNNRRRTEVETSEKENRNGKWMCDKLVLTMD